MIRRCNHKDFKTIYSIINEAAQIYKGAIPADRWKIPYMSREELEHEIHEGVVFWGYEAIGRLMGVMGIQVVQDVTLIRHAYVRPEVQNQGIGTRLLSELCQQTDLPILIGTWAAAAWAMMPRRRSLSLGSSSSRGVSQGVRLVSPQEKNQLLEKYWSIPARQVETSVVLADRKWFRLRRKFKDGTE